MSMPNFFFVGAAKSGTTTLHDVLAQHPDVFLCVPKEPCFFSDGWPHWVNTIDQYRALFKDTAGYRIVGEASTTYFDDPQVPQRIVDTIKQPIKILISLRNPVERAFSHWEHTTFHEGYEQRPFEDCVHAELHDELDLETLAQHPFYRPGFKQYVQSSLYAAKVKRYQQAFGRDNVYTLIFEQMLADPAQSFADLFSFLGIHETFEPTVNAVNRSRTARLRYLRDFLQNPPTFVHSVYNWLPPRGQQMIYSLARRVYWANQKSRSKSELSAVIRERLMAYYLPDIYALENVLQRDLQIWYDA